MSTTDIRKRLNIAAIRTLVPVTAVTVWRWMRAGKFPACHYIGARRYWFADEIEEWLRTSSSTTTPRFSPTVAKGES